MQNYGGRSAGGRAGGVLSFFLCLILFSTSVKAQLTGQDVLILVNQNSKTSQYVARLYRQYHPDIPESQVLYLSGLKDCSYFSSTTGSTAADEIITREEYNTLIAEPVRAYLADANYPERITQIKVIVTTAGMPYRIEDTTYGNVIYAAGSNANTVISQESSIDAASVESELTCLWYSDYDSNSFGLINRMVNPYQGYRGSSMTEFPRQVPGTKQMDWTFGMSALAPLIENPLMEGLLLTRNPLPPFDIYYGTANRNFHVGDMYLTTRLDGPKDEGKSAVFAVRQLLERAKRASDPALGVNPAQAVAVIDDAPTVSGNYDYNRVFNLNYGLDFFELQGQYWDYDGIDSLPPDAPKVRAKEDYIQSYIQMTNSDPTEGILNIGQMAQNSGSICVMLDRRKSTRTSQTDLDDNAVNDPNRDAYQGVVFLATFGKNGDENNPSDYLLTGGPGGGNLFNVVNGAVFTSIESFNAVTMFFDVATSAVPQGKLIDFIEIGGSGAVGHIFEPQPDAAIDNEFLAYNLLADADGDGIADLTFVEAAFTAIPYLSWSEIVIGDPLMRIAYGPGEQAWWQIYGDTDNNGTLNFADVMFIRRSSGGKLETTDQSAFERYNDLCDIDQNGTINFADVMFARRAILGF